MPHAGKENNVGVQDVEATSPSSQGAAQQVRLYCTLTKSMLVGQTKCKLSFVCTLSAHALICLLLCNCMCPAVFNTCCFHLLDLCL